MAAQLEVKRLTDAQRDAAEKEEAARPLVTLGSVFPAESAAIEGRYELQKKPQQELSWRMQQFVGGQLSARVWFEEQGVHDNGNRCD
jgi:hypothetical protein